jgi:hypothetical protein
MSRSSVGRRLPVEGLTKLELRSHEWLRVDLEVGPDVQPADLRRGENLSTRPIPAVVKQQGPVGDLIGTFWATVYAFTSRFRGVLQKSEVSGWGSHPIDLRSPIDITSDLSLLLVRGRAGPVFGVGGIVRQDLDPVGQYLDPSEWDGSDLFLPANRSVILVTERNVALEPAGLLPSP